MKEFVIKYWLGVVFSMIITGFGVVIRGISKDKEEHKTIKNGLKALLRDRIIQQYDYYINKPFCPIYAIENVNAMFKEFDALGSDETIEGLVKELRGMPHKLKEGD